MLVSYDARLDSHWQSLPVNDTASWYWWRVRPDAEPENSQLLGRKPSWFISCSYIAYIRVPVPHCLLYDWHRGILGSIRLSLHPSRSPKEPHSLNFFQLRLDVSRLCVLTMHSSSRFPSRFLFLSRSMLEWQRIFNPKNQWHHDGGRLFTRLELGDGGWISLTRLDRSIVASNA